MEIVKHSYVEQWDQAIDDGVSRLTSIQSDLEGIVSVLGQGGMEGSIGDAFRQIHQGASDLQSQIALIEDEIKEIESDPDCEIVHLSDGTFAIAAPEEK